MRTVGNRCGEDGLQLAGLALGEMTRLAASPAGLWEEILRTNADCVAEACREFAARLPHDARALTAPNEVAKSFEEAGYWRSRLSRIPVIRSG
jgi:prephenate dehydrogenase